MKFKQFAGLLVMAFWAVIGFAQDVATVNGQGISQAEFDAYLSTRIRGEATDQQKQQILNEMIDVAILSSEARKKSLEKDPSVALRLKLQESQLLANAAIRDYLSKNPVTDADLKAAYDRSGGQTGGQEFKARHILLDSEDAAKAVITELKNGGDFAQLARDKSTGPSARNGGDLGWFQAQAMVKPFADAVAAMEKGKYSQAPVKTDFGYHVILLEDVRAQSFETVKENFRDPATQQKIQDFIDSLRNTADVKKES